MTEGAGGRRTLDPSGWLIVRRDGNVVTAERRACELLGAPDPDALAGREWTSLLASADAGEAREAVAAIESGGSWDGVLRFRYARDEVTLSARVSPVARSSDLVVLSLQIAPAAPSHTRSTTPATPQPRPQAAAPRPPLGPTPEAPPSRDIVRSDEPSVTAGDGPDGLSALVTAYEAMHDLDEPTAIARSVLQAIESAIGFQWAAVLRFEPGPSTGVTVLATYPTPMAGLARGGRWAAEPDLLLVRTSGEPSIQGDLGPTGMPSSPLDRLPAFGLRSRVLVPLYAGAEVMGALALFRAGALAFTAAEAMLAERTVRRLGDAIAGASAERSATPAASMALPVDNPPADSRSTVTQSPGAPVDPPLDAPKPAAEAVALAGTPLESLGELVAGVAHELNNPLTAILGYAQILGGLEGTEREHALRTIEDEAQRAARIVRNLLSFARQRPGQRRVVNIEEMLRRVIDLRRYALEVDDVHVITRLGLVPDVMVDEGQFEQVFLNLLGNAQQALQGRGGEVVVSTWQDGGYVYIAFADDGPGVPEEIRSRIFEPFFTTREVGLGQGMGLAIVYGVVSHHGGRTWVEPNASGGATFVVEIPLPPVDEGGAGRPATRPAGRAATGAGHHADSARRTRPTEARRVLVVDDEGAVRALTREILSATGYEVDTAEGGEEALHLLAEQTFDLIITDLRMPGMDGATLYREVVSRWPELARRVLFVTGDIEGEPGSRSLDASVIRYLEKPFTTRQLLTAVQDALAS
ncbi:MAG: response regulator [Dehalococcoidia bacterium]